MFALPQRGAIRVTRHGIGGEELLKAVRQDPKGLKLPIIMITARTSRGTSWLAGANAYLPKPFTDADFEKAVKTALVSR